MSKQLVSQLVGPLSFDEEKALDRREQDVVGARVPPWTLRQEPVVAGHVGECAMAHQRALYGQARGECAVP